MAPVFAHGRLRLYLLKLLHESPRHGYEVIRLLEERFQGLYAPSAGTVYPRLAKLEKEGLVTHSTEGGRKVYALTDGGRAELAARADEIAGLEAEIRESVSSLAAEIREDVRGAAGDLRQEMRAAARQAGPGSGDHSGRGAHGTGDGGRSGEDVRQQWKEQARQAKEEARDARRQAKAAREAMDSARDEVQRIARQVQEQVQSHARAGDWQTGLREGLAQLTRELGQFGQPAAPPHDSDTPAAPRPDTPPHDSDTPAAPRPDTPPHDSDTPAAPRPDTPPHDSDTPAAPRPDTPPQPGWYRKTPPAPEPPDRPFGGGSADPGGSAPAAPDDGPPSADPLRDLERLLDRFRDDIRDTARDRGVSDGQLREVRRHLSAAAAQVAAALHRASS